MKRKELKMTQAQKALVEANLDVVTWAIRESITINERIPGLGWDDLFGEGCVWLCRAAQSFEPERAQFSTYAKKVVRNGLISYCRQLSGRERHTVRLTVDEDGEMLDRLALTTEPDDFALRLADTETAELLRAHAKGYSGVARLGMEALCLKIKGMSVTEIAAFYNVPPSHVGAWISRGTKKLRADRAFLDTLR